MILIKVKTVWTSVIDNPVFMRRFHGWLTIGWLVMIPVAFTTGLVNLVAFVSGISLWALVGQHWGAWQSVRVEVAQSIEVARVAEEDLATEVSEHLIAHTNLESSD